MFAQAPQSFKYQSVVRDANGNAMQNQTVDFKISILQTSSTGAPVYVEEFSTSTNNFGLVNLNIGTGTVLSGTFSAINWGTDNYFLQVELDADGNGYQLMGTSQLLSVPYALNAAKADNVNNNDTSATNELQTLSQTGTDVSLSNGGGTISVADNDNDSTNEIQAISFSGDTLYLSNGSSVYLGNYSNIWQQNGNDIYYNNGYVGVGLTDPHGKLIVQGDASIPADSAIFEVRNQNGQVVFAVYQEGVRVYVDDTGTKAISSKGGFAIGGFNATKSLTNEYLRVTPDSVRVYIEEGSGSKAIHSKGGFAIGGFNATKTSFNGPQYFNVSASDTAGIIPMPGEARVMWYPLKEAFLSGHVIIESPDSIGLNSIATGYESKAIGNYSQALGYKARALGNNSMAIGYNANSERTNSYAFGNYATAQDSGSYAFGSGAKALGLRSFALGSTGVDSAGNTTNSTVADGNFAYAFGMGSIALGDGAFTFGTQDSAVGNYSLAMGYQTKATDWFAVSLGHNTLASGEAAFATGENSEASFFGAVAMGLNDTASALGAVAMGADNKADKISAVAMGEFSYANGEFSIALGFSDTAKGAMSFAACQENVANGWCSSAFGHQTVANGYYSTSFGENNYANGEASFVIGSNNFANGENTFSGGENTTAHGITSFAYGDYTKAQGWSSTAIGVGLTAKSYNEFVIGQFNDTTFSTDTSQWVSTDPLFIIGNGLYPGANNNAVTVLKNGNVGINTNTADKLLTVNGDARVSGDIYYGAIGSGTTYNKPDFVFKPNYSKNFNIDYIEKYINRHGHLPWLTAAKDEKDGINMTRMSFETLEAVENQQLQIIQLRKENQKLKSENKEILKRLEKIEKQLKSK